MPANKLRRKGLLGILAIIVVLSTILSGCNSSKSGGKDKYPKEVTIGYQVIPNAELLVKTKGLAEKKFPNVKINWKAFDSGRDVNTAIAANSIDLGLAGSVPVAIGVTNKLPYQVYFLHDIIGEAESLAVRNSSGVKSVKDLAGKKVGVPFGSTAHFSLLSALKLEGLDASKVTILDLQPQDILAAWQRKDIDGAFVWNPILSKLIADDGSILVTAQQLADKGSITADVGVVRTAFANDYPNFLKDYVSVLDEAVKLYRDKPEEVAKDLAPVLSTDEKDALAQTKQLVWLTSAEQSNAKYLGSKKSESGFADVLLQTAQFLVDQKQIPSVPKLEDFQAAIRQEALKK
ncbi:taurine ABC transporter substrate-binding protein [Cohnella abietis]|uniref:Glycine/betaine ABC transporter substrate-binding protein n=1 Tax=Cohnella abietis TaxID=2507935 RepID=A0A3T1D319_9BACL|nr:ABC transporter substrate-binding protein [Cohnella abietis]BBI32405.1 glycine/betaine ABC transporter substrate-binding protein [Cohnella abietis]